MSYGKISWAALAAAAMASYGSSASAEVSFEGKNINYIIASNAGGGTDRAARLFGQFLEKYLPGSPKMIYRNMGAGGGKIRSANYLALEASRDGFAAMGTDSTVAGPTAARSDMAKYDPLKFIPVGGLNGGGSVLFARKDAIKRLKDPGARPVIVGGISGTRTWQVMPLMGKEYLGWNAKWIVGYKGTGSLMKAIRQGEIDMFATANDKRVTDLLEEGVIGLVAQEGQGPIGDQKPRRTFPEPPIMYELLAKDGVPEIAKQAYLGWIGASQIDKWVTLPPGVPKAYVEAWRAAFDKAVNDKEFQRLVEKQVSNDAVMLSGEQIEKILVEVNSVPDSAMKFARDLRRKYDLANR